MSSISKEILTAEEIAERCDHLNGQANIAGINRLFRAQDDSHKYPVCNKFDATERAIRRLRRDHPGMYGLEYATALEDEIGRVVNAAV